MFRWEGERGKERTADILIDGKTEGVKSAKILRFGKALQLCKCRHRCCVLPTYGDGEDESNNDGAQNFDQAIGLKEYCCLAVILHGS